MGRHDTAPPHVNPAGPSKALSSSSEEPLVLQAPPVPSTTTVQPCPWRRRGPTRGGQVFFLYGQQGSFREDIFYIFWVGNALVFWVNWEDDVTNYNQRIPHLWQQRSFSILPCTPTSLWVGTGNETCCVELYDERWWRVSVRPRSVLVTPCSYIRRPFLSKTSDLDGLTGKSWTAGLSQLDKFHFRCQQWINHHPWWGI